MGSIFAAPSNDFVRSPTGLEHRRVASRATNTSSTDSVCSGNTAEDRSVWCDFDTSTNYYKDGPDTGVLREYWFNIVNTTLSPDGIARTMLTGILAWNSITQALADHLLVNGSFPGPTVEANWYVAARDPTT